MGVGTFAVNALIEEARRRGVARLTVLWERGEESPEEFFLFMGFVPIGETPYGEIIGAIQL
jgi:diamine N-acetyltransferase